MASVSKRTWNHGGEQKSAWVVRYVDRDGKQRQETYPLKKQADAARRRIEEELHHERHIANSESVGFGDACESFLRLQEDRCDQGAISRGRLVFFKQTVDAHFLPALGTKRCHHVTAGDVEELYMRIINSAPRTPGLTGGSKRRLSPTTARNYIVVLGQVFDHCLKRRWVRDNPVPGALKAFRGTPKKRIRTFTREEVRAILKAVEGRGKGGHERNARLLRCFVHLAVFGGMRLGEILGLKREHVRLDKGLVEVRHSLNQFCELKAPKTAAGVRDVELPPHLLSMLREWIEGEFSKTPGELLFVSTFHASAEGHYARSAFHQSWCRLVKRAGISGNVRFHALRHFYASAAVASGMPVTDVAKMLGHASYDLTLQTYAHGIMPAARRAEAVGALAAAILSENVVQGVGIGA